MLLLLAVGSNGKSQTMYLDIRNTVALGIEMLGHRKPRSVVEFTSIIRLIRQ